MAITHNHQKINAHGVLSNPLQEINEHDVHPNPLQENELSTSKKISAFMQEHEPMVSLALGVVCYSSIPLTILGVVVMGALSLPIEFVCIPIILGVGAFLASNIAHNIFYGYYFLDF